MTDPDADADALRAVGRYLGWPLPHPGDCRCSQHQWPCPHDLLKPMGKGGRLEMCHRCSRIFSAPQT